MKFIITEVLDWELDEHEMAGDSSRMPDHEIDELKVDEYNRKIEEGNWPDLPYECDAEDEEDAIEQYNSDCCRGDYYKATEVAFADEEGE